MSRISALELLERCKGGRLEVGDYEGAIDLDDLVIEVSVKVRRRVAAGEALRLQREALEVARREPWLAARCCGYTTRPRRSSPWNKHPGCTRRPTAAIVTSDPRGARRDATLSAVGFHFACASHHEIYAGRTVVQLPRKEMDAIRRDYEARLARRRALCRCGAICDCPLPPSALAPAEGAKP